MTGLQLSDAPLFVPEQQPARIKGHRWMIGPTSVLFKIQTRRLGRALSLIRHVFFLISTDLPWRNLNHHGPSVCEWVKNDARLDSNAPSSKFFFNRFLKILWRGAHRGIGVSLWDYWEPDLNEHVCSWGGCSAPDTCGEYWWKLRKSHEGSQSAIYIRLPSTGLSSLSQ